MSSLSNIFDRHIKVVARARAEQTSAKILEDALVERSLFSGLRRFAVSRGILVLYGGTGVEGRGGVFWG